MVNNVLVFEKRSMFSRSFDMRIPFNFLSLSDSYMLMSHLSAVGGRATGANVTTVKWKRHLRLLLL